MASPVRLTVLLQHQNNQYCTPMWGICRARKWKNNLHFRGELADQFEVLFPVGDDEGAFIIPALDARSHVLGIKDRRNGVGKSVVKHAPLGSGQTFELVTPDLCVPRVAPEVLHCVLSSQQGQCVTAAPSPRCFSPLGESRRPVPRFPLCPSLCVLFDSRCCSRMNHRPALGKIIVMHVGVHAIHSVAFSFLLCDTGDPDNKRISTSHVLRRSCSEMPHAYKWDPFLWIVLLILFWHFRSFQILASSLMFLTAHNNSVPFPASSRSRWRQDALQTQP